MNTVCRQLTFPVARSLSTATCTRLRALPDRAESLTEVEETTYTRRYALGLTLATTNLVLGSTNGWSRESSIYDYTANIFTTARTLSEYQNQVLVVVNVARLRKLVEKYGKDGFNLIAFPCNQFGGQAPGTSQEEREYAIGKFGFEFDVFDKIEVNGSGAHPLYKYMKRIQPLSLPKGYTRPGVEKGAIEWNYTKFLINREGKPVRRYSPSFDPLDFEGDVVNVLQGKDPLPTECLVHPQQKFCQF